MGIYFDQNNKMVFDSRDGYKVINTIADEQYIITDIEGNTYTVVAIGNQLWISSNLKTTKYSNNLKIPNISNYDDWFLPSKNELNEIYTNLYLYGIGNFTGDEEYWSSSEANSTQAWLLDISPGVFYEWSKSTSFYVRACRSFTGSTTYNLRDVGPAGGYIFFITGSTYYEAAPYNQPSSVWSNISTTALTGSTGTAIGTGKSNTIKIIQQSGHTNSGALYCDSLTSNGLWTGATTGAYCWYKNEKDEVSDWFLPSRDELVKMHDNLYDYGIGNFMDWHHWTSTETSSTNVNTMWMPSGSVISLGKDAVNVVARPARVFTSSTVYNLRDNGPSGGWIFHIVNLGGGIYQYYECSVYTMSVNQPWSNVLDRSIGTTGTAIGTGTGNTLSIIAQSGHTTSFANDCAVLTTGYKNTYGALYNWHTVNEKFDDWFLPSKDELNEMYTQLKAYGVGGFTSDVYWAATESTSTTAWTQNFASGTQASNFSKGHPDPNVRACRSFIDASGAFTLRDTGPAGGLIFHITGVTGGSIYYEAGSSDLSSGMGWSNVQTISCDATGTTIGSGLLNTDIIILQSGHTNSAALICRNYVGTNYKLPYFKRNGVYESGWRVPTVIDYDELIDNLSGSTIAGGKLKEVGTTHWYSPNTGALNTYDFTLLPGGYRGNDSVFYSILSLASLWSTTENSTINAWEYGIAWNSSGITKTDIGKVIGCSVRCVKNINVIDPFDSHLKACWTFEEGSGTFYDQTTNNNDLTSINGVTYQQSGKLGSYSARFTESTAYAEGGDGLELTILSISAWIKITGTTANFRGIYAKDNNTIGHALYVDESGHPGWGMYTPGFTTDVSTTTVNDGNWHHILATISGGTSSTVTNIYIDNGTPKYIYISVGLTNPTANYRVGGWSSLSTYGIRGYVDSVMVWDKILSASERNYIYNSGTGRDCSTD